MAFKMKGFPKHDGVSHEDNKKTAYTQGDVMDESNASEEMIELYNMDTGVEYEADPNNKEWQRRKALNEARKKYAASLGNPTGLETYKSSKV